VGKRYWIASLVLISCPNSTTSKTNHWNFSRRYSAHDRFHGARGCSDCPHPPAQVSLDPVDEAPAVEDASDRNIVASRSCREGDFPAGTDLACAWPPIPPMRPAAAATGG